MLHISIPLADVGRTIFELDLVTFLQLVLVDLFELHAVYYTIILIDLLTEVIVVTVHINHILVIQIKLVLWIHFIELGPNAFTSYDTPSPCLEPYNNSYILLKVILP
jgi:hypothetical protein